MGDDSETSVVNRWQQCWDIPNLYIKGGSPTVTSAAVTQTSTIGTMTVWGAPYLRDHFQQAR